MPQVSDLIDAFMIEGMTDQQKIDLLDYLGQDAIVSAAGEKFNSLDTAIDSKLNSSDVVDDLMTSDSSKALSAGQGVALKGQVDGLTPPAVATESNLYAMTGLTAVQSLDPSFSTTISRATLDRTFVRGITGINDEATIAVAPRVVSSSVFRFHEGSQTIIERL